MGPSSNWGTGQDEILGFVFSSPEKKKRSIMTPRVTLGLDSFKKNFALKTKGLEENIENKTLKIVQPAAQPFFYFNYRIANWRGRFCHAFRTLFALF
jgi:hypothetical protein